MQAQVHLPNTLEELRALERQIDREWWRLHGALNAVAQMRSEPAAGGFVSIREMQEQVREVDRRRVEIAVRMAELEARLRSGASGAGNSG